MSVALDLSPAQPRPAPVNLAGLTRAQLKDALVASGAVSPEKAKMRSQQVWRWIHHYGVTDFERMTDIGKDVRAALGERFVLERPQIVERQESRDGTLKWLIRFAP